MAARAIDRPGAAAGHGPVNQGRAAIGSDEPTGYFGKESGRAAAASTYGT
jgi:hypothetical protein